MAAHDSDLNAINSYTEEQVAQELSKECGRVVTVQEVRKIEAIALFKVKKAFIDLGISGDDIRG